MTLRLTVTKVGGKKQYLLYMIAYDEHMIPLIWLFNIVTALDVGHRVWLYSNPTRGEKLPSKFGPHIFSLFSRWVQGQLRRQPNHQSQLLA